MAISSQFRQSPQQVASRVTAPIYVRLWQRDFRNALRRPFCRPQTPKLSVSAESLFVRVNGCCFRSIGPNRQGFVLFQEFHLRSLSRKNCSVISRREFDASPIHA